ncbi:MAG: ferrous iron transport protein B [Lentisphaerae bacterium]|nr:ferrous iron transport protein B [Lentisphaerota bacterium]
MPESKKLIIVGSPNVGKSVIFNALSGSYAAVSNYPGTTVEVLRGRAALGSDEWEIVDTPGMYSFSPITEEERVARQILLHERADVVVHVVDAKNLEQMLPLTLQLLEAALPAILVLNMMDEAEKAGVHIRAPALAEELGIPVVPTVATSGKGLTELKDVISRYAPPGLPAIALASAGEFNGNIMLYAEHIEKALVQIAALLSPLQVGRISGRALGLLLLKDDQEISALIRQRAPNVFERIQEIVKNVQGDLTVPFSYRMAIRQKLEAGRIVGQVATSESMPLGLRERLSRLMMSPLTGFPILLAVLYWGLYKFVGEFGAGTVVDFLEGTLFEGYINPFLIRIFTALIPWAALRDLIVGEYGMLTLGLRYAVALILPLVTFFFLVFAVIEDTGYLPRLAMLIDRTFKKIGLSGRAVIPMVLGLGCDTMATMVTRTLPTRRERVIATLLLALAVPCSAQLGVILALLQGRRAAMLIWAGLVALVFLLVGYLAARILPGRRASFYIEVPPLRWPKLSNVLIKTYTRVAWYFREVLPLFLLASVLIWLGQLTRLFDLLIALLRKPMVLIGLPAEAAKIFLFGFFRRDYGAAGLYDLNKQGALNGVQLVVACIALTLFLPCIAQFLMNVKERGWKTGVGISAFILLFSFLVAYIVNFALTAFRVSL